MSDGNECYHRKEQDKMDINERFDYWCKKLRISPQWDIKLEMVEDPNWAKTGDFKMEDAKIKKAFMNYIMD